MIADPEALDVAPHGDDFAGVLVAEDEARRHLEEASAARDAEVGPADPARPDPHHREAGHQLGIRYLLDRQRPAHALEHGSSHGHTSLTWRVSPN